MIFTTTKKKEEKFEKYPNIAVLTLLGKTSEDTKFAKVAFSLNTKAMEGFGFPMNTPSVSKIANGYDENNNVVLAAIDTEDSYTSLITAKNTFNSQKLANRLDKAFPGVTEFELDITEVDGVKFARVNPLKVHYTEMHEGQIAEALLVDDTVVEGPAQDEEVEEVRTGVPEEEVGESEEEVATGEVAPAESVKEVPTAPANSLWD